MQILAARPLALARSLDREHMLVIRQAFGSKFVLLFKISFMKIFVKICFTVIVHEIKEIFGNGRMYPHKNEFAKSNRKLKLQVNFSETKPYIIQEIVKISSKSSVSVIKIDT